MSFRRVYAFLVVVLICAWINNSNAFAEHRILGVTSHRQHTLEWCWAASTAAVVEYENHNPTQDCQVLSGYDQLLGGPGMCCDGDPACQRGGMPGEIERILNQVYNLHGYSQHAPLAYNQIKQRINAGHPVIVVLWRSPTAAHVVVIVGYNDPSSLVIMDPMQDNLANVNYFVLKQNWMTGVWGDTIMVGAQGPGGGVSNPTANYCCDQFGQRRCTIPQMQVGASCYCFGIPGTGITCQ